MRTKEKNNSIQDNKFYFDKELYKERYVIERNNEWRDSFYSLLSRFDPTVSSGFSLNYFVFKVLGMRKSNDNKKSRHVCY